VTYDIAVESLVARIPKHWRALPFRRLAALLDVANTGKSAPLLSLASTGVVAPREEFNGLGRQMPSDETIGRYWLAKPDDLIVNPMWLIGGGIGVSAVSGAVSPDYRVYRLGPDLHPRYVHHLLRSQPYRDQYKLYTRADTTFDRRVSKVDFHAMPILVPPLAEQRRIADFLDTETARIDHLVTLQQKVRFSVEARTTAQLNLTIDKLREEYGTLPFRRMIWSIEQGSSPQCHNFPADAENWGVLKVSAVKNGAFWEDENKQLPDGIPPDLRYEIKHGDLLITRANTPQLVGAAAVASAPRGKLMLCDKIFRVATTGDLLPDYLVLVSLGARIRDMCAEASHGTSQSMANLKTEEIKRWPIPAAPVPVQEETVRELTAAREHAASLNAAIDNQLRLLAERRQAVITAAVTGVADVMTAGGVTA